jgi:hypothetical protein
MLTEGVATERVDVRETLKLDSCCRGTWREAEHITINLNGHTGRRRVDRGGRLSICNHAARSGQARHAYRRERRRVRRHRRRARDRGREQRGHEGRKRPVQGGRCVWQRWARSRHQHRGRGPDRGIPRWQAIFRSTRQRGREDSNPRLLVLEITISPTDYALQSQTSGRGGPVGTQMGTRRRQLRKPDHCFDDRGALAESLPGTR